jgi:hypothetical protein
MSDEKPLDGHNFSEASIKQFKPQLTTAIHELEKSLNQEAHLQIYIYLLKYYETLEVIKGRRSD